MPERSTVKKTMTQKHISTPKPESVDDLKKKIAELEAKLAPKVEKKVEAPAIKKSEKFDKEKEMSLVKGMFKFHDERGGTLKWFDKFPWRGAKMVEYVAKDNEVIEIPYYVARRLMEKGQMPVYNEVKDENGMKVARVTDYRRRFDFFPMGQFINVDMKPRLSKVTKY